LNLFLPSSTKKQFFGWRILQQSFWGGKKPLLTHFPKCIT
jgi:hypothetical protein